MLYYSGESQLLGDVDKGDTVLDYLKIERERGITINAAAITLHWKNHNINLIDTPGHVDFTAEVERSVRVLDGAVTILDGVAGVQAQTQTVWSQADRYGVPRLVFINKLDREGASVSSVMDTIRDRLRATPVLLQLPVGSSKAFSGVVDLLDMQELVWDAESLGIKYDKLALSEDSTLRQAALEARNDLVEQVAELDDQLMEHVINNSLASSEVPADVLRAAIRRVTLANKAIPVLLGSSLKNIGVQPVMDAVIDYLPSPLERASPIAYKSLLALEENTSQEADSSGLATTGQNTSKAANVMKLECDPKKPLVAQAFKVVHEARTNSLVVYVRVYAGTMTSGMKLMNTTKGKEERSLRITRVRADRLEDLKELGAGDIGAVTGLKNTSTGDTLVAQKDPQVCVTGMRIPQPVFFMSILADTVTEEDHLRTSLNLLQLEDPSFKWMVNKDTGQWTLCGMGELHLEILKDRLFNYYKVKATTGDIQIAYKSQLKDEVSDHWVKSYSIAGKQEDVDLKLEISSIDESEEVAEDEEFKGTRIEVEGGNVFEISESALVALSNLRKGKNELIQALTDGAHDMFRSGIPAGFPLVNTKIILDDISITSATSAHTYKLALMDAIFTLARQVGIRILEPIMKVELVVDDDYAGGVLSDLTSKRTAVIEQMTHGGPGKKLVTCQVPLKLLMGYSTDLRSLSKGTGSFMMEFAHNGPISDSQQTKLLGTNFFN
jgi:elongation factor G